jgi:hypothetical protein
VTVKSGNDIILIDRCGATPGLPQPLEVVIFANGELTPNTKIIQLVEGRKYKVLLPIGTEVIVNVNGEFLNVWIQPSAADFNTSRGLCGIYNRNGDDDLSFFSGIIYTGGEKQPNDFSRSWRVNSNQTHYNGVCEKSEEPTGVVCQCSLSESVCISDLAVSRCLPTGDNLKKNHEGVDVTEYYMNVSMASPICQNISKTFWEFDPDYVSPNFSWPTPSGFTEQNATDFCTQFIKSSEIGLKCVNQFTADFNRTLKGCVSDIQIMDDTEYAIQALSSLLEQCLSTMSRSVNLWVNKKPDTEFINLLCPRDCNRKGNCTDGLCLCEDNYAGADCSVDLTVAPKVTVLLPSVKCDAKSEDCLEITLLGGPFIDSGDLQCIFQQIDFIDGVSINKQIGKSFSVNATFISYEKIGCKLPFVASFIVQVTQSVNIISQGIMRQVYNSDCFSSCNNTRCILEAQFCFIENLCYQIFETNPDNSSLVCDTTKSVTVWIDRNAYPRIDAQPQLSTRFDENSTMFYLQCDWSGFNDNDTTLTIFAQWYQDDELITETEIERNVTSSEISHIDFTDFAYGKKIYCGLIVCKSNRCNETRSPAIKSNDFKLEVKILNPSSLELTEGAEDKVVRVTSNFPPAVFCDVNITVQNTTKPCNLFIGFEVAYPVDKNKQSGNPSYNDIVCPSSNKTLPQLVLRWMDSSSMNACGIMLTNQNWQLVHSVIVRAVIDGKKDGDQERDLIVSATLKQNITVAVRTINVKVIDTDQVAVCQSINDPHMTTFDGKYYNNYNVGEFILYRHTTLPYEVRSFYRKCNNNRASCNCAVVVKAGDDTVRIDRCGKEGEQNGKKNPLAVDMFLQREMTTGLSVAQFSDGKKYEITLPSSTKVVVRVDSKYLNIIIQASSYDFGKTEGLCGTFDGDDSNDLLQSDGILSTERNDQPNDFSLSWRVKQEQSLYAGFCGTDLHVLPTDSFCACGSVINPDCGVLKHLASCQESLRDISGGYDITARLRTAALEPACTVKFEYDPNHVQHVSVVAIISFGTHILELVNRMITRIKLTYFLLHDYLSNLFSLLLVVITR